MNVEKYLKDPCRASSLPFWKTEYMEIPKQISIYCEDEFSAEWCNGVDDPYFKLIHNLKHIRQVELFAPFEIIRCDIVDYVRHINECYAEGSISFDELYSYQLHPVFASELWIAVWDSTNKKIVASGIGEMDIRLGEGILEWIQVSPKYRHRGLGQFIVCELLQRMRGKAEFVTVSGRINNPDNPMALYRSCGFINPVIWHIVTRK